ncbi:MAG TPA: permease prefix domain 1-containing protein, partial [Terriglobales bacterium]
MHWLKSLFGRERREQEFDRELQFHIEAVARGYEAKGLTPAEAHRTAMLEFGGKEQTTQELRDIHVIGLLERGRTNVKA